MAEKKARTLELFYKPTCPYCHKVLAWMSDHDVENVTLYDISTDSEAADRLVKVGGKRQVPCLFIDSDPLYESDDIIAFLAELIDHLQHIPCDKLAVGKPIEGGIFPGRLHSFRHNLYTRHMAGDRGQNLGNRTCPAI